VAKFPEPDSARLAEIGPEVEHLANGTRWWRVYFSAGGHPSRWNSFRSFGPVETARFDHHVPPPAVQRRRTFYAASSVAVCLAEVFQDRRRFHFDGRPRLTAVSLARDVRVLDLRHLWPTRAGASQGIASGPRGRSRAWARAVADVYDVEGLLYRSSMHGGDDTLVLWDCPDALPDAPDLDIGLDDHRLAPALHRVAPIIGYTVAAR